jgi:hypothetical protein
MDPQQSIAENGFYFTEDPEVGRLVDAFAAKQYPFQTKDGLAFLQAATLDNKVRRAETAQSYLMRHSMFEI